MNWWAENTDPAKYQKRVDTKPFKFIASQYGEDDSIIEIGCGAGVWADNHKFYGKKGMYKGTDVTPEYVEESWKQHPEFQWEVADANWLSDADKTWDIGLAIHAIEYTMGYEKPVLELCRVAKKKVILCFWVGFTDNEDNAIRGLNAEGGMQYSIYSRKLFNSFLDSIEGWNVTVREQNVMDGERLYNYFWILEAK